MAHKKSFETLDLIILTTINRYNNHSEIRFMSVDIQHGLWSGNVSDIAETMC